MRLLNFAIYISSNLAFPWWRLSTMNQLPVLMGPMNFVHMVVVRDKRP
jgi:hypothetical protein